LHVEYAISAYLIHEGLSSLHCKEGKMKVGNVVRISLAFTCVFVFFGTVISECVVAQEVVEKPKESRYTVQLIEKEGGGKYLADSKGMSLYYFKKDFPSISACINVCLTKWPIFFTEKLAVQKPLKKKEFGVFMRDYGETQTTYKGWPLYYFSKDKKPGDMNGEGVNGAWYVIYPDKFNPDGSNNP
jgi:predicted lipoprotein with Yx(FWY)xxD motif